MFYVEPELLYGFSFLALFAKKILCHLYNGKHSNPIDVRCIKLILIPQPGFHIIEVFKSTFL